MAPNEIMAGILRPAHRAIAYGGIPGMFDDQIRPWLAEHGIAVVTHVSMDAPNKAFDTPIRAGVDLALVFWEMLSHRQADAAVARAKRDGVLHVRCPRKAALAAGKLQAAIAQLAESRALPPAAPPVPDAKPHQHDIRFGACIGCSYVEPYTEPLTAQEIQVPETPQPAAPANALDLTLVDAWTWDERVAALKLLLRSLRGDGLASLRLDAGGLAITREVVVVQKQETTETL